MKHGKTLTPREAAVVLGCGMKRLYELLYSQKIAATKTNGRWSIPFSAIESRLKDRNARHRLQRQLEEATRAVEAHA